MGKHFRPAKDFRKKGMTVEIRPYLPKGNDGDAAAKREYDVRAFERALHDLKDLMFKEGVTKELRSREYFMSKGQKRRQAKAEGIMRYRSKMRDRNREVGY